MENCPPSQGTPVTPGKKRRSWFEPGKSLTYNIAVEQPAGKIPPTPPDAEIETLTLTHFTAPPRIDFGELRVNKDKCRYLRVENPEDFPQKVLIEKFPHKKGFTIDKEKFVVEPESDVLLTITWNPGEGGNCREMILFRIDGVYRLQAYVFGKGTEPPKPSKRKGLGNRGMRKPFGEMQLSSIQRDANAMSSGLSHQKKPQRSPQIEICVAPRARSFEPKNDDTEIMKANSSALPQQTKSERAPQIEVCAAPKAEGFDPDNDEPEIPLFTARFADESSIASPDVEAKHKPLATGGFKGSETVVLTKNESLMQDTLILKETFLKRGNFEEIQDDTPSRRTTFRKDDPELPATPLRRDTFMKARPILPNTPVIPSLSPRTPGDLSSSLCPSNLTKSMDSIKELDTELDTPLSFCQKPQRLDRCSLLGRKLSNLGLSPHSNALRDVSQSPQLLEERLKVLQETPEALARKSPENVSPVVSNYCTAFTTPYRSPENVSEGEDEIFEDSLMYVSDFTVAKPEGCFLVESEVIDEQTEMEEEREVTTKMDSTEFVVVDTKTKVTRQKKGRIDIEIVTTETEKILKFTPTRQHLQKVTDIKGAKDLVDQLTREGSSIFNADHKIIRPSDREDPVHEEIHPEQMTHLDMVASTPMVRDNPRNIMEQSQALSPIRIDQTTCTKEHPSVSELPSFNDGEDQTDQRLSNDRTTTPRRRRRISTLTVSKPTTVEDLRRLSQIGSSAKAELFADDKTMEGVAQPSDETCTDNAPGCNISGVFCSTAAAKDENITFPMSETCESFMVHVNEPVELVGASRPAIIVKPREIPRRSLGEKRGPPVLLKRVNKTTAAPPSCKKRKSLEGRAIDVDSTKPKTDASGAKLTRTQMLRRAALGKPAAAVKKSISPEANKSKAVVKPTRRRSLGGKCPKKTSKPGVPSRLLLIKKAQATVLPKHPLPYAAKNVYYDERWLEKQERGFVAWLNFVLTPPDEYVDPLKPRKINAGALCLEADNQRDPHLAPTKEVLSYRAYSARRKLNRLRRAACSLFQSESCVRVTEKLEREITCGRIAVRPDRKMHVDLGIKQRILELLLSYNPLWLRMGLETVFGELVPVQSSADVLGLSRFILARLLNDPDISDQFKHPSVPHLYRDGYDVAMAQFTLKKFLLLVYFLDLAKMSHLIDHDPCLFCKNSDIKTSREILITFARDYLRGEGDITRHLGYLGYTVSHAQTALDEFDFAVTNLASDLKDGIRLVRTLEMLTANWSIHANLRVPAISRLQKIHNVGLAIKALTEKGVLMDTAKGGKVEARDIVDGHRQKTHALLWSIIFNFQVEFILNEAQLRDEIRFLQQNLHLKNCMAALESSQVDIEMLGLPRDKRESVDPGAYFKSTTLSLLLRWCAVVCAYYGLKVENFTVSFSDGRAFCYLLHHYHPGLLPMESIHQETTLSCHMEAPDEAGITSDGEEDSFMENWTQTVSPNQKERLDQLLANEKQNFKVLHEKVSELGGIPFMVKFTDMSNTIPDEKIVITFVSYLCARMLDLRDETRAARTIQAWWRARKLQANIQNFKERVQAAVLIQRIFRVFLERRREERVLTAVLTLQRAWRWRRLLQRVARARHLKEEAMRHSAAKTIQACVRRFLDRQRKSRQSAAAVYIQAHWKGLICRRNFAVQRYAAILIQQHWRAYCQGREDRQAFMRVKSGVVALQRIVRMRLAERHAAAVRIQAFMKGSLVRRQYLESRSAAVKIQSIFRCYLSRRAFETKRAAAVCLQQRFRAWKAGQKCRDEYRVLRSWVVKIQRKHRWKLACRERAHQELLVREAATKIQAAYRAYVARRQFWDQVLAARLIQATYRMHLQQKHFLRMKQAAVVLQRHYRAKVDSQRCRAYFVTAKAAVITIQSMVRGFLARKSAGRIRAAILIQAAWRGHLARELFARMKAAIVIQTAYRRYSAQKEFCAQREAATRLQSWFRMIRVRVHLQEQREAVCILERYWKAAVLGRRQRRNYLRLRNTVIHLQRAFRERTALERERAACLIQATFRMYVSRSHFLDCKNAAVVIQAWFRGVRQAQRYHSLWQAAIVVQRQFRANKEAEKQREEFLRMKAAALVIQKTFRMSRVRKAYLRQCRACIAIQAHFRGHLQHKQYSKLKKATVCLQRRFRANVLGSDNRRRFLQMKIAALLIQRAYRLRKQSHMQERAATKIQSAYRMHRVRSLYLKQREAAVKIQSFLRMWRTRKAYLRKIRCIHVLQTHLRSYLLTKKLRSEFLARRRAAVMIQSQFRMYRARRSYDQKRRAACQIQVWYRAKQVQHQYTELRRVAILLQQRFRANMMACKYQGEFARLKRAALLIQRAYRLHRKARAEKAAIRIQSAFRMHQAWKAFTDKKSAAIKIQSMFRMLRARSQYIRELQSVHLLQKHVRSFLRMKRERENFLRTRAACVVIQQAYRRHLQQKFLKRETAATVIQSAYRCYRQRKTFLRMKAAAILIQRCYRGRTMMRAWQIYFHVMRGAVIVLQSFARGIKAKKVVRQMRAARVIQKTIRGYICRKRYQKQRQEVIRGQSLIRMYLQRKRYEKIRCSAVCVQRRWRAVLQGCRDQRDFLLKKGAAITIQAWYKSRVCQKKYLKMRQAICKLQAIHRRNVQQKQFQNQRMAASRIQKWWRAVYAGRKQRNAYRSMKEAAICLQSHFRAKKVRDKVREMQRTRQVACLRIQTWFRAHEARQSFLRMKSAALVIQRHWRAFREGQKVRRELLFQSAAALVIQTAWRKAIARQKFHKVKRAVICLQAKWRGRRQRMLYNRMQKAAVVLQRWHRATALRKQCLLAYKRQRRAAVLIQRSVRRFIRRRNEAATKIQSFVRMWSCRVKFLQARRSAVLIQSIFRCYKMRSQFSLKRRAVTCLQKWWRATLLARRERRQYLVRKRAAITIQSWLRGRITRKKYLVLRLGVSRLSALVRSRAQGMSYLQLKNSALVMQQRWRAKKIGEEERSNYLRMKKATVLLQAHWRGVTVRRRLRYSRAIITIQSYVRMRIARKRFDAQRRAVTKIQACVRGTLARRELKQKFHAATVLQKWYRSCLLRRKVQQEYAMKKWAVTVIQRRYRQHKAELERRRNHSAITLQAHIRGYLVRRNYVKNRTCVITMQKCVRMWLAQQRYREMKRQWSAAVLIQRCFRQHLSRKLIQALQIRREQFIQRFSTVARYHLMAICIQKAWRHRLAIIQAQKHLSSVIIIQRWMRAKLQRMRYLKFVNGLRVLQLAARAYLEKRRKAARVLQATVRKWLIKRRAEKVQRASLVIQSHWRGRCVRNACKSKAIRLARKNVTLANRNARDDQKLGNRMRTAVDNLFKYKQLAYVLEAVMNIDVATRLSHVCCLELVEHSAVPVIYRLIRSCNRSVPHMEIIKYSINILLNLAKYEKTRSAVYNIEGCIDCLIELLTIYREKGPIFTKTCTLLGVICYDPCQKQEITSNRKVVEKLHSLHKLTARKYKMEKDRRAVQAKMAASRSLSSTLPLNAPVKQPLCVRPEWVLNKHKMKEIEDPLVAINFVADTLSLHFK